MIRVTDLYAIQMTVMLTFWHFLRCRNSILYTAAPSADLTCLNLKTPNYLPEVQHHQGRNDAWHGVRILGSIKQRE